MKLWDFADPEDKLRPLCDDDEMIIMMNCFCGMIDQQKTFGSGTIVRDLHHRESPTCLFVYV